MWFGPHAALTLCYQRPSFCLFMFFSLFFSSLELQPCALSIYFSHSLRGCFFSSWGSFSVSHHLFSELSHLLLHSCISLFQTACVWLSPIFKHTVHFKRSEISCFHLKSPWRFHVRHCHTLSLHPVLVFSPIKTLFVHHHRSPVAPGCCIRISSAMTYVCACVCLNKRAWTALLNHLWFHREFVHPRGCSQEPVVGMATWR